MIKIAVMIQAHKNFKQLQALIDSLVDENIYVFIHIDEKNDILYKELKKYYNKDERIVVIDNRVSVNWSGLSQIRATLNIMKEVYDHKIDFDRILLISGEDYLLKTKKYLIDFFTKYKEYEFIEYEPIDRYKWRIKHYNFFTENKFNRSFFIRFMQKILRIIQNMLFISRNNLKNKELYKGSQWFNITGEALKYIIENGILLDEFKHTACSDEHYFQIILLNSKFKDKVINNNLRYIIWEDNKNSPKYLKYEDLLHAKKTDNIFARKVSEDLVLKLKKGNKF